MQTKGPVTTEEKEPVITAEKGLVITGDEGPVVSQTEDFSVRVYPNPATSYFNLNIKSSDNNTPVTVRVLNVNGKVLSLFPNVPVIKSSTVLRVEAVQLTAGIYFAEVTQGSKRKTVKMIKVN